jgi:hypothetical protein
MELITPTWLARKLAELLGVSELGSWRMTDEVAPKRDVDEKRKLAPIPNARPTIALITTNRR